MARSRSTLSLDLTGGALCAVILGLTGMFVLRPLIGVGNRVDDLRTEIRNARSDLQTVDASLRTERVRMATLNRELESTGKVPPDPGVGEVHRLVSELAEQHGITINNSYDIQNVSYPGLFEYRHRFEATGAMHGIEEFLLALERDSHWVDVGFISITRSNKTSREDDSLRLIFVISVFSAGEKPSGKV